MKKATDTTFLTVLNKIHEADITTKKALLANQDLYNEFGLALMDFCHFALKSETSKNENGEVIPGNAKKVYTLKKRSGATVDDLEVECAAHIIKKLNNVLAQQPIEKQKNYCYVAINNHLTNLVNKPEISTISWDANIRSNTNEDGAILANIIHDNRNNPESCCLVKEAVLDILLREVSRLSTHGPEILVRMGCLYLGIKPKDLAARIIRDGYETTFAQIIVDVASEYDIELNDIRKIITVNRLTEESYKKDKGLARLLSGKPDIVADQISKYFYRAKGRIK